MKKLLTGTCLLVCLLLLAGCDSSNTTTVPTQEPAASTSAPTQEPSKEPTTAPTDTPTPAPTSKPTDTPTPVPTDTPTQGPAIVYDIGDKPFYGSFNYYTNPDFPSSKAYYDYYSTHPEMFRTAAYNDEDRIVLNSSDEDAFINDYVGVDVYLQYKYDDGTTATRHEFLYYIYLTSDGRYFLYDKRCSGYYEPEYVVVDGMMEDRPVYERWYYGEFTDANYGVTKTDFHLTFDAYDWNTDELKPKSFGINNQDWHYFWD
ncbi:MAG: hypothetical protein IJS80_01200 [Lachnospiraceae bacterium]|nr:hypothetical protein [Lachnospiraceae bacterium]